MMNKDKFDKITLLSKPLNPNEVMFDKFIENLNNNFDEIVKEIPDFWKQIYESRENFIINRVGYGLAYSRDSKFIKSAFKYLEKYKDKNFKIKRLNDSWSRVLC